jgi:tetratricopeptide (TPR) repeat protein
MKKCMWCLCIGLALLSFSCTTRWSVYSDDMFHGKRLLQEEEYAAARQDFVRAAEAQKWPAAYAFAATASYKMGDLTGSERYIAEAERLNGNDYSYLRVLGYKSLILLKEGKENEGREALQQYARLLRSTSSPKGATQIDSWMKQQSGDLPRLEKMIDEQVSRYESDIEQYQSTGTGFYNRQGNYRGGPSIIP